MLQIAQLVTFYCYENIYTELLIIGVCEVVFSSVLMTYSVISLRLKVKTSGSGKRISPRERLFTVHLILFIALIGFKVSTYGSDLVSNLADNCDRWIKSISVHTWGFACLEIVNLGIVILFLYIAD